jgi:hypothetical protein
VLEVWRMAILSCCVCDRTQAGRHIQRPKRVYRAMNQAVNIFGTAAEADAAWFADELEYAWRRAQDEAVAAYHAWCESPGSIEYAVYRAAQDRADQAQEVLASRRR